MGVVDQLQQDLDLALATFAIVQKRLAHEDVILVDQHRTVPRGHQLIMRTDEDAWHDLNTFRQINGRRRDLNL